MGKLFRDGKHPNKFSLVGKRRIKEGECAAVWDSKGNYRIVQGPKLERVYLSNVSFLDRKVAHQNEYLIVKFKDGRKEHVRGPHAMYVDPVKHQSVTVHQAIELNDYESIVVYTETDPDRDVIAAPPLSMEATSAALVGKETPDRSGKTGSSSSPIATARMTQFGGQHVERRIVVGPSLFTPAANEWLHEFSWHGRVQEDKAKYKAGLLKFQKIRTLPSTLYYNVSECRTSDDAELEIKLMIFYHMNSLQQMLDTTHDPIGEILNGVCADVIRFSSDNTFLSFVQRTSELNDLNTFEVLRQRAEAIGFTIDKVVFRGYKASDQLQAMHDQAIKTRTKLRLESDTVEQEQQMLEMKLGKSLERVAKEQEMEREKQNYQLEAQAAAHKQRIAEQATELQMKREHRRLEQEQELAFLQTLSTAGVDLTRFLCSKNQQPDSVKVLRIEGDSESNPETGSKKATAHIHLGD